MSTSYEVSSMKALFWILIITCALLGAFWWINQYTEKNVTPPTTEEPTRYMDIESYVRTSINELSPTKAVLGGTFFVTKIETANGVGVVEYEDGHIALIADFTYVIEESGKPTVLKFIIRGS